MPIELQAGGNLRLPSSTEIRVDIRWEPERPGGQEIDASAFLLGADGKVGGDADFVFFNNPRSRDGAVTIVEGSGAHRHLRISPGQLPDAVSKVAVCLSMLGAGSFAGVNRIEVRVRDAEGTELAVFAPNTKGMAEAALILGQVYRYRDDWKFRALAQGFAGGLGPLAADFGVDVATDGDAAPTSEPASEPAAQQAAQQAAEAAVAVPASPNLVKAPATGPMPTGSTTEYSPVAGLNYEILYRDAYALARVDLPAGGSLKAQADAMVAMSATVDVGGAMSGGLLGGLGRLVSGESLFLQTLTAARGAGSVYLAPTTPGDIAALEIQADDGLVIQRGGFLACSPGIEVSTQVQNLAKGLFSGEGFFILKAQGSGLILLESFGAIHSIRLGAGEQRIIDNGHLVAWSQSMSYNLEPGNPGLVAAFTSGENIVCRFYGPGLVLLQSRQPRQFGRWVSLILPG